MPELDLFPVTHTSFHQRESAHGKRSEFNRNAVCSRAQSYGHDGKLTSVTCIPWYVARPFKRDEKFFLI